MKVFKIFAIIILVITLTTAQSVWNGDTDVTWLTSAPGASEYTLTTAEQLAGFAKIINENLFDLSQKTIKLGANIKLNETSSQYNVWVPIGTGTQQFKGVFDGNNHTISGVYIDATSDYKGLFYEIPATATIKNLEITDSYIKGKGYVGVLAGRNRGKIENCKTAGSVHGTYYYVGGLIGRNNGIIINSHATVNVIGDYHSVGGFAGDNYGTIKNSSATGDVTSSEALDATTGGLVGANYNLIDNCYAKGNIDGGKYRGGGLVGTSISYADSSFTATITNSYATGNIIGNGGGLVANNNGKLTNSYSTGNLGLVGSNTGTITNCYSTGNTTLVSSNTGKIINSFYDSETSGKTDTDKGEPRTTAQMQSADFVFMLNLYAFNLSMLEWIHAAGKYPTFGNNTPTKPDLSEYFAGGNGTQNSPYIIMTKKQLEDFAYFANIGYAFKDDHLKLGANITINDTTNWLYWDQTLFAPANNWNPIGNASSTAVFNGTFDGDNRVISGMFIKNSNSSSANVGLFGFIAENGVIKNLGVKASYIANGRSVGILAAYNRGIIANCYTTGIIMSDYDFNYTNFGGLVAVNYGTIDKCYATGDMFGTGGGGLVYYNGSEDGKVGKITNSYATGNVKTYSVNQASSTVGGLVGHNYSGATITNCYATGNVEGGQNAGGLVGYNDGNYSFTETRITNCYSTGLVTAKYNSGGLIGNEQSKTLGYITNSYYDKETSGKSDNDGRGEPRTTAQMKTRATFVRWDFENIWDINPSVNNGYPYLDLRGNYTPIREINKSDNKYGIRFAQNIVSDKAEISVILPNNEKSAEINIVIYDNIGNIVAKVSKGRPQSHFVWDLKNTTGRFVANGTYLVIAEIKSANGNVYHYSAKLGVKR